MTSKLNTDKTTCFRQKIKRITPLVKTGEHSLLCGCVWVGRGWGGWSVGSSLALLPPPHPHVRKQWPPLQQKTLVALLAPPGL